MATEVALLSRALSPTAHDALGVAGPPGGGTAGVALLTRLLHEGSVLLAGLEGGLELLLVVLEGSRLAVQILVQPHLLVLQDCGLHADVQRVLVLLSQRGEGHDGLAVVDHLDADLLRQIRVVPRRPLEDGHNLHDDCGHDEEQERRDKGTDHDVSVRHGFSLLGLAWPSL